MTEIKKYLVGGAVRDQLLGMPVKDFDYSVEAPSFEAMETWLKDEGYTVFLSKPEFNVVRAKKDKQVADFVLARKEGPYSDHRHPDWTKPGTLEDDLRRRDFTVNAMARSDEGELIDLFDGQTHLAERRLVAVGNARERMLEDPLRVFRAIRFAVVKGFEIDFDLEQAMRNVGVQHALRESVSRERVREELTRAFQADTMKTMKFLLLHKDLGKIAFEDMGLWLRPTSEGVK